MDVIEFSNRLCQMNTVITKYLDAKRARDFCSGGQLPLPNVVINTIADVLDERICQCEKKIIEQATKLTDRPEEQPIKKKK
ncbi:hypothetical protein ES702_07043 [subsurface metagenome]